MGVIIRNDIPYGGGGSSDYILPNQLLVFTNKVATIIDTHITEDITAEVYYEDDSYDAAKAAQITAVTENGKMTFTALNAPTDNLVCTVVLKNAGAGSGSASGNYNALTHKPQINGVELIGDKDPTDLGLSDANTTYVNDDGAIAVGMISNDQIASLFN